MVDFFILGLPFRCASTRNPNTRTAPRRAIRHLFRYASFKQHLLSLSRSSFYSIRSKIWEI